MCYQTLSKCSWRTNSLGLNLVRRLFPDVLVLWSGRWGSSQRAVQRQIPAAHPPLSERGNSHSLGWRGQACCNNTQSSRRKHSYVAQRPAVYKDSPPPSLDSLFSLDFRSSEFQPGRQASGRHWGPSSALCTQLSQDATPEGIPRLDPEIPFWQLAFTFLFTCCINFVAIFAFCGSLHNLWWCNKTQVTCRIWVCRWLCFGLFHFKEDSETASETGN